MHVFGISFYSCCMFELSTKIHFFKGLYTCMLLQQKKQENIWLLLISFPAERLILQITSKTSESCFTKIT